MDPKAAVAGKFVVVGADGKVIDNSQLEELTRTESDMLLRQLALEIWRSRRRFNRLSQETQESAQALADSITRMEDVLLQHEVRFAVHDGEPYDPGLALEVLETRGSLAERSVVIETVTPTVTWRGRLLHRGQVVVGAI